MKINVPENFNFGYDVVDAWAAEQPDKNALLWTNDKGESRQFSFADMKRYTDMTASYFQSLGIGRGDMVMLILNAAMSSGLALSPFTNWGQPLFRLLTC